MVVDAGGGTSRLPSDLDRGSGPGSTLRRRSGTSCRDLALRSLDVPLCWAWAAPASRAALLLALPLASAQSLPWGRRAGGPSLSPASRMATTA